MGRIEKTGANLSHGQKTELLRRWFTENEKSKEPNSEKYHWEEDQPVAEWLENQIKVSFDKIWFFFAILATFGFFWPNSEKYYQWLNGFKTKLE